MNVFGNYAHYYDLLYRDKDYSAEVAFVLALIRKRCPDALSLLDLGCGTGAHAQHFAQSSVCVHGVDRSAPMLEHARGRLNSLPAEVAGKMVFSQGDVREVRLSKTFDAITSLFHVVSYQIRDEDIRATLATARQHLKPGGVFVFDCWYGPAVLTDRPTTRVKRWEDNAVAVTRIAEPIVRPNENIVDVNYTIFVRDKKTGAVEESKELHRIRYLFRPEVEMFALQSGLHVIDAREWMTENEPGLNTWSVCFVSQRN